VEVAGASSMPRATRRGLTAKNFALRGRPVAPCHCVRNRDYGVEKKVADATGVTPRRGISSSAARALRRPLRTRIRRVFSERRRCPRVRAKAVSTMTSSRGHIDAEPRVLMISGALRLTARGRRRAVRQPEANSPRTIRCRSRAVTPIRRSSSAPSGWAPIPI